ncbi:hypothetical protein DICPUDRAFT_34300 [Dictyostelium purpureum]|uniref:Solute carrier family 40 member n=1 Tax=Dictyostelium purpureum TaxID=5786 RepID=F0ZMD0_DICPU|nr:uncharacterized protein DICPUDRAFT_34300 [Dictyostelium purpureum]EGC34878.1 hypothetical protein DICPUDRAFT_34300 [Dictyostelium purpureum]|eukprot:XP_003288570.1 hypothetical protein DICPUDRAFT_34300 [Dictyostelium purpureum]
MIKLLSGDGYSGEDEYDSPELNSKSDIIDIQTEGGISETLGSKMTEEQEESLSYYIMLSHFITRMGDRGWEFIVPLFLIFLSPKSLIPVSLFGLSTTLVRIFFGTTIGNMADKYKKLQIIKLGVTGQAVSIGSSCIFLYLLFKINNASLESQKENGTNVLFDDNTSVTLFCLLLFSSALHSLSGQLMDISVERKWTPSFIKHDTVLTRVNTRMRQIDLSTEVLAPFLAGLITNRENPNSFLLIGLFNFVSFFPQYILLKIVYDKVSPLGLKVDDKSQIDFTDGLDLSNITTEFKDLRNKSLKEIVLGEWNPLTNIIVGWRLFYQQNVFLIMVAYILLWFTVLSPHDSILTAYLSNNGYSDPELGLFRGLGAVFGLGSTLLFGRVVKLLGNITNAALGYILEEGILVLLAGFFFSSISDTKYVFMLSIIFSRCGLYGFELTEIHFVQRQVPDNIRGVVSGVESSLCSLATLSVFVVSIIINSIDQFYILVWGSILFVNLGWISIVLWRIKNKV